VKEERIPNDMFRQKYLRSEEKDELTLSDLAYRMGMMVRRKGGPKAPDATRVARLLGTKPLPTGKYATDMKYDDAVLLCQALHIDYWEAGV
jgi:hypothetical protein